MGIKKISKILPQEGQNITNYINAISEEKKEYFVPFSANYLKYPDTVRNALKKDGKDLKDARINYFTKNGIGQLTLEYNVFDGENITPQKLVLAIGEMNEGTETTRGQVQEIMKMLLLTAKNYSQIEGFENYVARIQKLGWTVTNECVDIAGISRKDGEVDVKRTIFTQDERMNITKEDIEQNQKDHFSRIERHFGKTIEKYIIEGYKGLSVPTWNVELTAKKKEIMDYEQSKKKRKVDERTMLGATFTKMNPLFETESIALSTVVMDKVYRDTINKYLEGLPDTGEIEKTYITTYLQIREEYLKTHDENSKAKLQDFLSTLSTRLELARGDKRKDIRKVAAAKLGKEIEIQGYEEENIETERRLGEEEKAQALIEMRKKSGPSADDGMEI